MKLFDVKIPIKSNSGTTYWKTIATVFASDDSHLLAESGKPATFAMDFPAASGIVVLREPRKQ